MSAEPIIAINGLAKQYVLSHRPTYDTFRDSVTGLFAQLFGRRREMEQREQFWALEDVSFTVAKGERIGIIGRNGAGKSTLLKILSRITNPTRGTVRMRGRIASLLEVGTGFHPELTGRENIFLNGSILGMRQSEIRRKFDDIVAFAEVEKFLDTPVKRYSSGMYVRLAFAVAAHLESEILIIDEVLAVGDAQFQKKSLGKMHDVAEQGRTVLFVSHNMTAIKRFCNRCVWLESGRVVMIGPVHDVVDAYLKQTLDQGNARQWETANAPGNDYIRVQAVRVMPPAGTGLLSIDTGVDISTQFSTPLAGRNLDLTLYLYNSDGILLFENGALIPPNPASVPAQYSATVSIPPHLINAGTYSVSLLWGEDQRTPLFKLDEVVSFEIEHTATGRAENLGRAPGVIRPQLKWHISLHHKR